jgi:hypothetical protein
MNAILRAFQSSHVQVATLHIDVVPAESNGLTNPKTMTKDKQDKSGITVTVAANAARGGHQFTDFIWHEIVTRFSGFGATNLAWRQFLSQFRTLG